MSHILIVDDQPYLKELFSEELMEEGYRVVSVSDAEFLKGYFEDSKPDLVLLDLYLDGFEGGDILHYIKRKKPRLPVLIFTAYDSYVDDPRVSQADGYVIKSFSNLSGLKEKIVNVIGRKSVNRA